ncbi:hypothetical protein [Sporolituus thermophilus]|uniref:ComK protein n=1 Tax=Sporolituus thermophilus DSM 23256 TaxID=1123285 RepID=A0A1G7NZ49_9FIRM|nr:hypothetical protein [Sporolituus thermophilus]SDF79254.1 hypothetical protein SAMN05660235_02769 [Sporolituus thermophilus DSM 23256]
MHRYPPPDAIAAILPEYTTCGDRTVILTTDGAAHPTGARVRTVLVRLARSLAADLAALRHYSARTTGRGIMTPLPLAPDLVLLPIKVRTPRVAKDPCTGYLNLQAVTAVRENKTGPFPATVTLQGGASVPVLWTAATVRKQLQYARLAAAYSPRGTSLATQEAAATYAPQLLPIAQKLVEVICDILRLKDHQH